MKTLKFKTTINCNNCLMSVTPHLNMLDNVVSWKVDLEHDDRILEVEIDDENESSVIAAVKEAGYEIEALSQ